MKAMITHKGVNKNGDTISIFDNDDREICLRRYQLKHLRQLLKSIEHKAEG